MSAFLLSYFPTYHLSIWSDWHLGGFKKILGGFKKFLGGFKMILGGFKMILGGFKMILGRS